MKGDLERLGRFWMSGTCKPNEQEKRASEPLSIAQVYQVIILSKHPYHNSSIFFSFCQHFSYLALAVYYP